MYISKYLNIDIFIYISIHTHLFISWSKSYIAAEEYITHTYIHTYIQGGRKAGRLEKRKVGRKDGSEGGRKGYMEGRTEGKKMEYDWL